MLFIQLNDFCLVIFKYILQMNSSMTDSPLIMSIAPPTSMSLDGIRILKESTVPSLEDLGTKLATLNLTLEPGEGRGDVESSATIFIAAVAKERGAHIAVVHSATSSAGYSGGQIGPQLYQVQFSLYGDCSPQINLSSNL